MRIAIASGKGGAGKTVLTSSLHAVWPEAHVLVDADVEAPNLHLFLHPILRTSRKVLLSVPMAVSSACTSCGACREICRYSAIARFGEKIRLFSDMCHGCGGCFKVCPMQALEEGFRELGVVESGALSDGTPFFSGRTRAGEVLTPPVIRSLFDELEAVLGREKRECDVLIDCPPGVSCPAVTVARRADLVLLAVDPTPFGLEDFRIAADAMKTLNIPTACVLNRTDLPGNCGGDERAEASIREFGLPLLGRIPFSREGALLLSRGSLLFSDENGLRARFCAIASALKAFAANPDFSGGPFPREEV